MQSPITARSKRHVPISWRLPCHCCLRAITDLTLEVLLHTPLPAQIQHPCEHLHGTAASRGARLAGEGKQKSCPHALLPSVMETIAAIRSPSALSYKIQATGFFFMVGELTIWLSNTQSYSRKQQICESSAGSTAAAPTPVHLPPATSFLAHCRR